MSNLLEDDPWGTGSNGWNNESPIVSSVYMGSSGVNSDSQVDELKLDESKVPSSYKKVYQHLQDQMSSGNDFETLVLNKLVDHHYFSSYQRTKIMNTIYDQNLLPVSQSTKFYESLGLIGLELDLDGTGDYVTLQFKINDLPELSGKIVDLLCSKEKINDFTDPLTSQISETNLNDNILETDWTQPPQPSPAKPKKVDEIPASNAEVTAYINEFRDTFKPLYDSKDVINIKEVPEKEGLLFKHINYAIIHQVHLGMNSPAGVKKVIRRYSDFVWLLEFLLKKYPFRVIPGLPPKKFTGASPDSQFLQRRRRGLYRFLNQIIKHPILRADPVVITFLSVPTDLASWKKQAQIDYSLEFKGNKISPTFMNNIWPSIGEEFLKDWKKAETNIGQIIETWTKIVLLVERYERRQQQIAMDNNKFVEMINKFQDLNESLYPHQDGAIGTNNKDDMGSINTSLNSVTDFFTNSSQIIVDDVFSINTTILEKFKNYLDYLYSIVELFERSKRLSGNNIGQLQIKIKENEEKFNRLNNEEADMRGSDLAKLKQSIINDKQEMFQQLNKDWLIKQCCLQEFLMFQETQYLLGELWSDWSKGRTRYQQKLSNLHESMNSVVINDMPVSRT